MTRWQGRILFLVLALSCISFVILWPFRKLIEDESEYADETMAEMRIGQELGVSGVPHFVLSNSNGQQVNALLHLQWLLDWQ